MSYNSRIYDARTINEYFANVDWDFSDAWTKYGLNLIHWYPTKLPPQVASRLINGLTEKGDVILDPFCGSGTVLAEALRLGRKAIGGDISPIAEMITAARTNLVPLGSLSFKLDHYLRKLRFGIGLLGREVLPLPSSRAEEEALDLYQAGSFSRINPGFDEWFHPEVLLHIQFASRCIQDEQDAVVRNILLISLSSLLRTLCSQQKSWGYIADNVKPKEYVFKDVYKLLKRRLNEVKVGMQMAIEQCLVDGKSIDEINSNVSTILGDARNMEKISSGSIDCIVTSPPYANVSDNVTSQRLSLLWLGYDLENIKKSEIGARWKRFRKDAVKCYFDDIRMSLMEMKRVLNTGGRLALVLGTSSKCHKGNSLLPNLTDFIEVDLNMKKLATYKRKIATTRQHGSSGVMDENIMIYQKV